MAMAGSFALPMAAVVSSSLRRPSVFSSKGPQIAAPEVIFRGCLSSSGSRLVPSRVFRLKGVSSTLPSKERKPLFVSAESVSFEEPLDLTEENIELVLEDARTELLQLFDETVGITGVAELADLDGPFVKLRLRGRFWHERSMVLARLANYLQKRIPEILEVDIEDAAQLSDSPSNF